MSVFESIKGTFTAGLKSITSRDQSSGGSVHLGKSGVNLDAGADLLNKYQFYWQELRENADINAKAAQDVDCMITDLYVNYDRQADAMDKFHEEAANLPKILTMLQDLTDVLASLEEEYDKVEAALVHLESVCEEQDLAKAKIIDAKNLSEYKKKKVDEIEKLKVQFAKDHAKKMQNYEKKRQSKLKERQEVLEEAFKDDVDYYKLHGRLETLSTTSSTDSGKKVDLAEISWDNEDTVLDDFLGTDPLPDDEEQNKVDGNLDEEEQEPEEVFVEEEEEEEAEEVERPDVTKITYINPEGELGEDVDKNNQGEDTDKNVGNAQSETNVPSKGGQNSGKEDTIKEEVKNKENEKADS